MTGLVIVLAAILLLALALEPAHRRARRLGPPPAAAISDRDRQRLVAELRQLSPQLPVRRRVQLHTRTTTPRLDRARAAQPADRVAV